MSRRWPRSRRPGIEAERNLNRGDEFGFRTSHLPDVLFGTSEGWFVSNPPFRGDGGKVWNRREGVTRPAPAGAQERAE